MFINWKEEIKSPLLYTYKLNEDIISESKKIIDVLIIKNSKSNIQENYKLTEDQTRIILVDADRVFTHDNNKKKLIKILTKINQHFGKYHQSMSWVAGVLSLVIEKEEDIINILVLLNTKSMVLLWSSCPIVSSTYGHLVQKILLPRYIPKLGNYLNNDIKLYPETYFQKWICTMGIKLLNFITSIKFIFNYSMGGLQFISHFCLNIFKQIEEEMYNTENIYDVLNLKNIDDSKIFKNYFKLDVFNLEKEYSMSYYHILLKLEHASKKNEEYEDTDEDTDTDEEK